MENFVCPKCGRDYKEKPTLCKCGEFGFNLKPIIRRIKKPYSEWKLGD